MMAQYLEIKAANPDCLLFYRMGDFYELFFDDAEIASRALGIVLTKRGKHHGEDIRMCGVPVERADDYLQRLIGLGHRVAVCEQTEDPAEAKKRGAKSVVRRDVVRLVTPGTITEDKLLAPGEANLLVAVARRKASDEGWAYGLAALDISTGRFRAVARPTPPGSRPRSPGSSRARSSCRTRSSTIPSCATFGARPAPPSRPSPATGSIRPRAERRLRDFFGVATLDSFGAFSRAETAAAGAALHYVERTQFGQRPALEPPRREAAAGVLAIDAATRANLELTRTLAGERAGSLSRRSTARSRRAARGSSPSASPARWPTSTRFSRARPRSRSSSMRRSCASACAPPCAACRTSPGRCRAWRSSAAARATSPACATA